MRVFVFPLPVGVDANIEVIHLELTKGFRHWLIGFSCFLEVIRLEVESSLEVEDALGEALDLLDETLDLLA